MLTVSLHGIKLHAPIGLYPEEKIEGNDFEIDVDVFLATDGHADLPFVDYALIYQIVMDAFGQDGELLETFAKAIHAATKEKFALAQRVKVAIRKLHPPLGGPVAWSQVCLDE